MPIFPTPSRRAAHRAPNFPRVERELPCDLCYGREFELAGTIDHEGRPLATVICRACGLIGRGGAFHASVGATSDADRGESMPMAEHAASAVVEQWSFAEARLAELRPWLAPGARVFDAAAGWGCRVKVFAQAGIAIAGIESAADRAVFARQRLNANVACRRLAEMPPWPAHDMVLLVDALTRVPSPTVALRQAHRLLRSEGRLYLECPHPLCSAGSSRLFHAGDRHHVVPATLEALVRSCGFQIEADLAARAGGDSGDAHRLVLRRTDRQEPAAAIDGCAQAREAFRRHAAWGARREWASAAGGGARLARHVRGTVAARMRFERILAACQSLPPADEAVALLGDRRAA
jgi:hypothetical protein